VTLGADINSGEKVAIKIIRKSEDPIHTETILNEIEILFSIEHPNVIKLYNVFEDD